MRGRPKAQLVLSETEREQLDALTLRRKTAQALGAASAHCLGAAPMASDNKVVAARQRVTPQTVSKWRARFVEHRLDGLLDAPRPGAPRTIDDARVDAVIAKTLESVPDGATHWSTRGLAARPGLSQTAPDLARLRSAAASRRDLQAVHRSVVRREGARHCGPVHEPRPKALVLCVDEKSQIQALDRTQPLLPLRPGQLRAAHPRLQTPRHDVAVCGLGHCHRRGHRPAPPPASHHRVPAVLAYHRGQRAGRAGRPPHRGQLRHPQDARDQELVRPKPPIPCSLYPDLGVLAQPGGALVCNPDAELKTPSISKIIAFILIQERYISVNTHLELISNLKVSISHRT